MLLVASDNQVQLLHTCIFCCITLKGKFPQIVSWCVKTVHRDNFDIEILWQLRYFVPTSTQADINFASPRHWIRIKAHALHSAKVNEYYMNIAPHEHHNFDLYSWLPSMISRCAFTSQYFPFIVVSLFGIVVEFGYSTKILEDVLWQQLRESILKSRIGRLGMFPLRELISCDLGYRFDRISSHLWTGAH
jgi:hypothetical protein